MRTFRIICVFILNMIILLNCSEILKSSKDDNIKDDKFAIYFLKNEEKSYDQAIEAGINKQKLKSNPYLDSDDIDYYNSENEHFYLNDKPDIPSGYDSLINFQMSADIIPYVLKLNGKRFFLGSIIGQASSRMFAGPTLNIVEDDEDFFLYFSFSEGNEHYKNSEKYQAVVSSFKK